MEEIKVFLHAMKKKITSS